MISTEGKIILSGANFATHFTLFFGFTLELYVIVVRGYI